MLSYFCTATVAILLALDHQTNGLAIPQIYDYGGLFADSTCQLQAVLGDTDYLEWIANNGWVRKTCPLGTKFNAKACQCLTVPKIDGGHPIKNDQIEQVHRKGSSLSIGTCRLKPATDRTCYLELVQGHGFLTRACPEGTAFDAQQCGCTTIISETTGDDSDGETIRVVEDATQEAPAREVLIPTGDDSDGETIRVVEGVTQEVPTKEVLIPTGDDSDGETIRVVEGTTQEVPTKEVLVTKEVSDSKIPCTRKSAENSTFYMEFVQAHGWMARPCPLGTVFNTVECECLEGVVVTDSSGENAEPGDATQEVGSQESMPSNNDQQKKILDAHLKDKIDSEEKSDSSEKTDKSKTILKLCEMKADTEGNRYLELVEGYGWISRPCPVGTVFDAKHCQCTSTTSEPTHSIVPEKKPESATTSAACTQKPGPTETSYLQLIPEDRWVLTECAKGTVYNAQTCCCILSTDGEDSSKVDIKEPITPAPTHQPETDGRDTSDKSENDKKEPTTVASRPQPEGHGDATDDINEDGRNAPTTIAPRPQHKINGEDTNDDISVGDFKEPMTVTPSTQHKTDGGDVSEGERNKAIDTTTLSVIKDTQKETPCDSVITLLKTFISTQLERRQISNNAFCPRKSSVNLQIYFELSKDLKWITKECPLGMIFVPQRCRCSLPLSIDQVVNEHGQRPRDEDEALLEKMLTQLNILQSKTTSHTQPSSYPHHPTFTTRSPTQSKYVTVPDFFRIS